MITQNKWEKLFDGFLQLTEFCLIKHSSEKATKDEDEDYQDGIWSLIDLQGANLGGIEGDRFETASDILDRMDVYINDYILEPVEDYFDECNIPLPEDTSAEGLLKYREKFGKDYQWDFDIIDMIVNHSDDINLENCNFDEED